MGRMQRVKRESETAADNRTGRVTAYHRTLFLVPLFLVLVLLFSAPLSARAGLMEGYENPQDIIIASPAEGFSTTASSVSILGASDKNYPLTMNEEPVETTALGFFTEYVSLEIGENHFTFENGEHCKTLTIIRKEKSTGGSSEPVKYKEYTTPVYGTVTAAYVMTRSKIDVQDVTLMPLVKGTTFRILGEQGSYYKIFDGSFVSKSNVKTYKKNLPDNRVTSVTVTDDPENNLLVTRLEMNVNALYRVEFTENRVVLTLYETITTPKVTLGANDTVYRVVANIYRSINRTVAYTYKINEGMCITGYDVEYKDGAMYFYLKKQPHLEKKGSLAGATVVLDAGHGGSEPGAYGPLYTYGPTERHINLAITLMTKKQLEKMGATVILTRSEDTKLSLNGRVAIIRAEKPDLSLSIHANSMPQTANYQLSRSFLTYYSYELGNNAAAMVNDGIIDKMDFMERTIRRESLSLTRITTNPAVLIETAFLSYPADYEYLLYTENQEAIAKAAAESVKEYLESVAVYKKTKVLYTVKPGDYLSRIALKYNVTLEQLKKWNNITNVNFIEVGQTLVVGEK